jgi:putative endonuclease
MTRRSPAVSQAPTRVVRAPCHAAVAAAPESAPQGTPWCVYIVQTARGTLYTGITTSIERRFAEHGSANGRGARFFRFSGPAVLRYTEHAVDRGAALRREASIKRLSRGAKLALIEAAPALPLVRVSP